MRESHDRRALLRKWFDDESSKDKPSAAHGESEDRAIFIGGTAQSSNVGQGRAKGG